MLLFTVMAGTINYYAVVRGRFSFMVQSKVLLLPALQIRRGAKEMVLLVLEQLSSVLRSQTIRPMLGIPLSTVS